MMVYRTWLYSGPSMSVASTEPMMTSLSDFSRTRKSCVSVPIAKTGLLSFMSIIVIVNVAVEDKYNIESKFYSSKVQIIYFLAKVAFINSIYGPTMCKMKPSHAYGTLIINSFQTLTLSN